MKFLIITILLVLAVPAFAAKRTATPEQWKDIHAFSEAWGFCHKLDPEQHPAEEFKKNCATADRLEKKLTAQGFCAYGHIAIGRTGKPVTQKEWERTAPGVDWQKGAKHCYCLPDPTVSSYFHQC